MDMTVPSRTWGIYGRLSYELAQRKGHKVYNQRAFEDAAAVDGMRRKAEQAERWVREFVVDERRLAEWLVDDKVSPYAERRAA